jgi:transcriptional regulator with XRE-family HTH domain
MAAPEPAPDHDHDDHDDCAHAGDRWVDLGEFIREQRRVGELSLRKLSELAGVSNPYLSQIERGLRKPSADILQQLARALHISAETLYVRAGILDERDEDEVDVVAEIRRDPALSEQHKRALVSIYESFRAETAAKAGPVVTDDGDGVAPAASVG